ncbi:hypothetical protein PoMZ_05519, partial [Pyricularia oryzae]
LFLEAAARPIRWCRGPGQSARYHLEGRGIKLEEGGKEKSMCRESGEEKRRGTFGKGKVRARQKGLNATRGIPGHP